jgi:hypothetical protein
VTGRGLALALALVAVGLAPAPAAADAGPCPGKGNMSASTAERLRFIEARTALGARRSRAWALGWGLGLGSLTVGQLAILPAVPKSDRPDFYLGAVASGVGALMRAVFLPRVIGHHRRLRRAPPRVDCATLAEQEAELHQDARWENNGQGLLMHALNLGFNAGIGLTLGLAFDRPVAGNRLAAIGAVSGELMILSQPRTMIEAAEDYRRLEAVPSARWLSAPLVLAGGGGVSVGARF